jgi:hypothetical protein
MISLRRNRANLTDRGIELLTQREHDSIENGERGGIAVKKHRPIICPNCKCGHITMRQSCYSCDTCQAQFERVGNRPGRRTQ